jgi:hypothetical protein
MTSGSTNTGASLHKGFVTLKKCLGSVTHLLLGLT